MGERNTVDIFKTAKETGDKISVVTCYDYSMARLVDQTDIDAVLVGDSLGMTMLGHSTTLPVTMDDMVRATQAVVRGTTKAFVIADMPFMSYQVSLDEGLRNAGRLIQEGGANAVKIEGRSVEILDLIERLTNFGIPVVGHLGLTPQSVNGFGGFKAQGKDREGICEILSSCRYYEMAGVCACVLECIPAELAGVITEEYDFATIGIGAGVECDGEVQVLHDLLGMSDRRPQHSKCFANVGSQITKALAAYDNQVKLNAFPTEMHSTHVSLEEIEDAQEMLNKLLGIMSEYLEDDDDYYDDEDEDSFGL